MTAVFKYPADRSRVAVFAGIFAIDITVYFLVDRPVWLLVYFVVGILPKGTACAFNHHHQHLQTFKVPLLNRVLEVMYALQTGVSSVSELSNQTIFPYTDMLIHDMGEVLADGRPDFEASTNEWRTPPLWGIGLTHIVNPDARFLHDGRAATLEEAILWHGGEANWIVGYFKELTEEDRDALITFLESL